MKSFSDPAMAEIEAGTAIVAGAAEILSDPPVRGWSGPGTISLDGEDYVGLGDRGFAQQTAGALGGSAQGLKIGLSGIDPNALELLDADEIRGASAVVRRLIFSGDGKTLLDHQVFDRGRVDQVKSEETVGGSASINVDVESSARGLGRSGQRMRSDSDQRLIGALDGYFKHTAYAGEKLLYWGGKKPARAGTALGGSSGGGPSISLTQQFAVRPF